jgi:hypothetical protein
MWQRVAVHYPVWYEPCVLANTQKDSVTVTDALRRSGTHIRDAMLAVEIAQGYLPRELAHDARMGAARWHAEFALQTAEQGLELGDVRMAAANLRASLETCQDDWIMKRATQILYRMEQVKPGFNPGSHGSSFSEQQVVQS